MLARVSRIRFHLAWPLIVVAALAILSCAPAQEAQAGTSVSDESSLPTNDDSPSESVSQAAAEESPASTTQVDDVVSVSADEADPAEDAAEQPVVIEIGTDVGQHVPEFYILDQEFNKITSEEILSRGRPVFLHFFTLW